MPNESQRINWLKCFQNIETIKRYSDKCEISDKFYICINHYIYCIYSRIM